MNAPTPPETFRVVPLSEPRTPTPERAGVLITGAAQRLGRAIARDLASSGWPVVIHYNNSELAAVALREEILDEGGAAQVLRADLSDDRQVGRLIPEARELVGPIGVLINNASVFEWDDIGTVDGNSWVRHMDINLRAPMMLCQSFAQALSSDDGGVIVNMLDSRVLNPRARYLTYTLSKTGLWTMTRVLAQDLAPRIRVNGIGPGPTLPWRGQSLAQFEERCRRLPLQRPASLEEVCDTVRFLLRARSLTGQIIALDGGDHLVSRGQSGATVCLGENQDASLSTF